MRQRIAEHAQGSDNSDEDDGGDDAVMTDAEKREEMERRLAHVRNQLPEEGA
eukprot:COSAG06_NODE_23042_length_704_cov_1.094215_1_plen_52_part_00